jgi:hypothetical protein
LNEIKKGDEVLVTYGWDRGHHGIVVDVCDDGRVLVSGEHIFKKYKHRQQLIRKPEFYSHDHHRLLLENDRGRWVPMSAGAPELVEEFGLTKAQAKEVVSYCCMASETWKRPEL